MEIMKEILNIDDVTKIIIKLLHHPSKKAYPINI